MANLTGTSGTDSLVGTAGDDVFLSYGTARVDEWDYLSGLDGADTYDLSRGSGTVMNFIIDDAGSDGAADAITNVGALYYSASLGYVGYASAIRVGDDLILDTPGKPYRFRSPSKPSYHIEIKDQYGGGTVETLQAGGITYALPTGSLGTLGEDLMAGSNAADFLSGRAGNDWVFGNGGADTLLAGAGDDVVIAGTGRDSVEGDAGNDTIFGESGYDTLNGGNGHDQIDGGSHRDLIDGGAGTDRLIGGDGNDVICGGAGQDMLQGDAGRDWLIGGGDGDRYVFSARAGEAGWGDDVIIEKGNAASYMNKDVIELRGFYGPSDGNTAEAHARLSFARDGHDMLISADGGVSGIEVRYMFGTNVNRWFIEVLELNAGYWEPEVFQFLSGGVHAIGDDRNYVNGGYGGAANEVIFGTDAGELIYGDAGTNFIWTGAGADVLIYKENDNENWFGYGGGLSNDIVEDFDITQDLLDFTEIAAVGSLADLSLWADAEGDARLGWSSGSIEVSSILIELRGVSLAEVTAELFVFV